MDKPIVDVTEEDKFAVTASNVEIITYIVTMLIWKEFTDSAKHITMQDMITICNGVIDKFPILQLVDIPNEEETSIDELPSIKRLTDIVRHSLQRILTVRIGDPEDTAV